LAVAFSIFFPRLRVAILEAGVAGCHIGWSASDEHYE